MSDPERARELAQEITGEDEDAKERMLLAAFAALREECARVAEEQREQCEIGGCEMGKIIAAAIREATR